MTYRKILQSPLVLLLLAGLCSGLGLVSGPYLTETTTLSPTIGIDQHLAGTEIVARITGREPAPGAAEYDQLQIQRAWAQHPAFDSTPHVYVDSAARSDAKRFDLKPDFRFPIGKHTARVVAVRPWSGLVPLETGRPMALIAVRMPDGKWVEDVALKDGDVLNTEQLTVAFIPGAEDPRLSDLPPARWGVRDKDRVHWFESFLPGTGVRMSDGTDVTLLSSATDSDDEPRSIRVRFESDGMHEEREINLYRETDPVIVFQFRPRAPHTYVLTRNNEGQPTLQRYDSGGIRSVDTVRLGETLVHGDGGPAIRVDQVLRNAAPVPESRSPLMEALIELDDGRRIRVRQAETRYVDGFALAYIRKTLLGPFHYTLELIFSPSETREIGLQAGQSTTIWHGPAKISLESRDGRSNEPTVTVQRLAALRYALLVAGGLLAIAAIVALAVRLRRKRAARAG